MSDSYVISWAVAHQAPLPVGLSRQEYWNGLPFPSLRDLPSPGIKPMPPALQTDSLPLSHLGSSNKKKHFSFLNQEKGKMVVREIICSYYMSMIEGLVLAYLRHRKMI